eukprot:TRINITY_DN121449_c0_g1_i1.p1 TRINITY_DN121449_c0_g1~~TRINITY_DN121449_c0_g1_i1.p1  ORF type:complete len:489 (-),score=133.98 TRINITY_DN121449_c0_g1_i1:73-1539(-)
MANGGLKSLLREEDLAIFEEDAEQNAEVAARNAKMRETLRARKRLREETRPEPENVAFTEFMEVAATATLKKRGVDEALPPWFVLRPHIENTVLRLHEEILDFMEFMKHTKEEVKARRAWVQTIANACRRMWPDCKVRVFGSFFTGLSLPNGDVDIAITDVPVTTGTAMKMLAEHMLARGEISWLEMIESAKVPIIKVRSQSCGLRADIVFNKADGIDTSKFIKDRMKEYPMMKPLLVFLKYFLLQRGLHETYGGGMGSYLLCNVVLHFLQRHPARKDERIYASTSLGHYLYDFLKYYGQEFRYDDYAISVTSGGRIFSKSERETTSGKGKGKGKKGKGISLCLESPLDESIDLGGAAYRMGVLKNLFHHGFHCLCHLMVTRSPPEVSMITPLLLDPAHPVIADRHRLMSEQPVAMVGLPRACEKAEEEALLVPSFSAVLDKENSAGSLDAEPPAKKRRTQEEQPGDAEEGTVLNFEFDGEAENWVMD